MCVRKVARRQGRVAGKPGLVNLPQSCKKGLLTQILQQLFESDGYEVCKNPEALSFIRTRC